MSRILVVDDDAGIQAGLATLLSARGHEAIVAGNAERAIEGLADSRPDLVLLDVWLPGTNGLEAFREIKKIMPRVPVIMMTASSTTDIAIRVAKLGAFDYQLKPFDPESMLRAVEKALASVGLMREMDQQRNGSPAGLDEEIIGQSPAMQRVYRAVGSVAATDATVLIRGESGTGKELVARSIHQHSRRSSALLVTVNCVAIPETLLESELFGYERGAFTGASARRRGKFEHAEGGTILLDEIGDVPIGIQSKILRVLQEKTFERIGGNETLTSDVRILAATNRNIEQAMAQGRFREDLYHRLNVVSIYLPALRERREDIPSLSISFLVRLARELGIENPSLCAEAMKTLCEYPWPGNVRELEHCLHRALIYSRGYPIQGEDIRRALEKAPEASRAGALTPRETSMRDYLREYLTAQSGTRCHERLMDHVEREVIAEALRRSSGNQSRAAELLGIPRPTLHAKLQKHGIRTTAVVEETRSSL